MEKKMHIPIVMAAFGTTSRAIQTYDAMDLIFRQRFPEHEIYWSYGSRMVKDRLKHKQMTHRPHPHQVLDELARAGHKWAVVQSLHLSCGHEFYRLVDEADHPAIRTSVGMPLLCSPQDHQAAMEGLTSGLTTDGEEAVIFVGHGTDHPAWTTYTALAYLIQARYGRKIYIGVIEDGHPDRFTVVRSVVEAGFEKVRLVPLMLVAGVHFAQDLAGGDDSWKAAFTAANIQVELEGKGLGLNPQIVEIFCRHIEAALDVIPHCL
jgi:sirohydrochlorin cobaltochelatase